MPQTNSFMHYSGRWSTDNAKTQKHDHVKRRTLTLRFRVSPLLQKSHRYRPKSPARISSGHAKKKKESPSVQFSTEAQRYTWNHKDEVTLALVPLHDEAYYGLATQTSQIYGNALRATLPKGKSQAQSRWSSEMSSKLHHAIAKMKATALRNEVLEDIQAWGLDCDQTQCTNWPVVLDPLKGHKYVFDKPEAVIPLQDNTFRFTNKQVWKISLNFIVQSGPLVIVHHALLQSASLWPRPENGIRIQGEIFVEPFLVMMIQNGVEDQWSNH